MFSLELLKNMINLHLEWKDIGLAYDGNSSLFSSQELNWTQTEAFEKGLTFLDEVSL